MRPTIVLLALPALVATPAPAGSRPFKDTSDYRKEQKGYLNVKFDTYARMFAEPKGTDCDWVFVDPSFGLEDVRRSTISYFPDSIGRGDDWSTYWGSAMGWYANPISSAFESSLGTQGIRLTPISKKPSAQAPLHPYAMLLANQGVQVGGADRPKQPEMTKLQEQMERDLYEEDKKSLGVQEAVKRAEAREVKHREDAARSQAETDKPMNPEEMPGYVLVLYLTESKVNTATVWIPFAPVTNTTTGEFVLLKDGKPVLAARHNSVGAYTSSAPKCGEALATAFGVRTAGKK